jgi:L-alanine-DL-glutamate epimerase-like enolase superfamily enzyme
VTSISRITEVSVRTRRLPLVRPFVTAVRTATHIDAVTVEVRDSDGRVGWGEAPTSWRVTGESPQSVTAAVEGPLRDAVLGLPVDDPEEGSRQLAVALVRNSAARMAVDCALYDLASQAEGMPLYRYLGGSSGSVRTDMTLSAGRTPEASAELIETGLRHRDGGFRTLKVKVGSGGDDLATVRRLREAVGDDVVLRVDANQGWSPQEAVRIIQGWEDAGIGIEVVEQPVHMDDLAGLEFVTSTVSTPILADESVWTTRDLREVLARRAADLVNIKLAKSGGLREALALLRLAADNEMGAIVGCMMESHIGISAAASLASAVNAMSGDENVVHDLDAGLWASGRLADGGAVYDGDEVRMPDAPGLGIVERSS